MQERCKFGESVFPVAICLLIAAAIIMLSEAKLLTHGSVLLCGLCRRSVEVLREAHVKEMTKTATSAFAAVLMMVHTVKSVR